MNTIADHMQEPPEDIDFAGEYVLGVLGAADRAAAERRIAGDASFAREVADWESRLMPLIDEINPVPPPYALWPRIRAAAGLPADPRAPATQVRAAEPAGFWQSAQIWRWLTAGGFAAAAASLVALFVVPQIAPPPVEAPASKPLVAKMVQDDGKSLFLATVDARLGTVVVQPTTVDIPANRVAELWLIPPGDSPHSLGLLDPTRANAVVVPKELIAALGPHALFAVTVEPPGGGPGGKPSGPIIAKGELSLLL
ncbi:MAG: anti-sigma factor [Dokdonella sp.]|uniref:anti-sigma factor n=1 Tax=Dokdonella sp. TaxID=2291710 RepID=UPI003266E96C